jgi:hypothetical protein
MRRSLSSGSAAELPGEIAHSRRLDLDHLGPEHGQLIAAERTGEHVGEVEHPDAFQKPRHVRRFAQQTKRHWDAGVRVSMLRPRFR